MDFVLHSDGAANGARVASASERIETSRGGLDTLVGLDTAAGGLLDPPPRYAANRLADGGPASAWAATASVGDPLAIAGPRGSVLAPDDVTGAVLIADETALPAFSRWLELLPATTRITAILDVADEDVEDYLSAQQQRRASVEWTYREDGPGQLEESLRSLGPIGADTYVWAAGEATTLVPLRRYLRHRLGLSSDQLSVEGYWKRGITNLDHHAPLDPSDPD
ncbi:MAG: siderophore-interacting protein [Microbacteriaceae bacterium]|nr:MAG: siderophore-interacting protein [Microbacteriaceae bacterium]